MAETGKVMQKDTKNGVTKFGWDGEEGVEEGGEERVMGGEREREREKEKEKRGETRFHTCAVCCAPVRCCCSVL